VESGRLFLPFGAPWLGDFEEEVCGFPGPPHDDIPDSLSQLLNYVQPKSAMDYMD
jgi:phage terminase large subunit-like protein